MGVLVLIVDVVFMLMIVWKNGGVLCVRTKEYY